VPTGTRFVRRPRPARLRAPLGARRSGLGDLGLTTYRLTIAYDGSRFAGWAAQPGLRTLQDVLESALEAILPEPASLTVAGRTDAGVHAWGQVASFEFDGAVPDRLARRLDAVLPRDVSVLAAEEAPAGFDARRSALSRTYCYRILHSPTFSPFEQGRALWHPAELNRVALDACAAAVVGTHDFTAFTPTETEHVRFERVVMLCGWRDGDLPRSHPGTMLELWIEADAFMRHMVRVLVGTMLEVGTGRRDLAGFTALLDGAPRDRAGETAPPEGLYLAAVAYRAGG
jgi:tRNA pseudouridine38-40 synthase